MAQLGPLRSSSEYPGTAGVAVFCAQVDGGDTGPLETEVMGREAPYPQGMHRDQHQCLALPLGVELDALSRG